MQCILLADALHVTWDATSFTCNFHGPVWCVGDFGVGGAVYLPIIMKNFP